MLLQTLQCILDNGQYYTTIHNGDGQCDKNGSGGLLVNLWHTNERLVYQPPNLPTTNPQYLIRWRSCHHTFSVSYKLRLTFIIIGSTLEIYILDVFRRDSIFNDSYVEGGSRQLGATWLRWNAFFHCSGQRHSNGGRSKTTGRQGTEAKYCQENCKCSKM